MKILLFFSPPYWQKLYPLNIAYLSGILKKYNIEFDVYDLNILLYKKVAKEDLIIWKNVSFQNSFQAQKIILEKYQKIIKESLQYVLENKFDIICYTNYSSNFGISLKIAEKIKQLKKEIKIIFGGPEILYQFLNNKNFYLNFPDVDFFVVGAGERTLENIIQGKEIEKLVLFDEYDDINEIPFPFYFSDKLKLYERKNAISILGSRGCINQCAFCAEKFLFKNKQFRRAENIFEEINLLNKNHNIKWFTFFDSMINFSIEELSKLCDLIIKNNLKINWDAQFFLKNYTKELIEKMKEAGCFNLFIGLESGSDSVLKKMKKNFTTDDAKKFFNDCKKVNLHFEISLIVNFPGETEKEFEETLEFLKANKEKIPKIAQINNYKKLAGIKIKEMEKNNRIEKLLNFLKENNFIYTEEFIGNLEKVESSNFCI
ncbi:MAG TPA: radical SAM protein [bacterium]|nr:radical SAM protein [bacterium]HOL46732.1 radical SAM protein [bacterium]HPQ18168.1 radical SAM protein [bacterium]